METLKRLSEIADRAIRDLEIAARGASYLASPYDCIELLNTIGNVTTGIEFDAFCKTLVDSRMFEPVVFYGRSEQPTDFCVKTHIEYAELGVEMDVEVVPHRMYGAKMTMRWMAMARSEETPDTETWKWQDLNNVSRIVIGYAVMTSMERDCFSRWEFFK